MRKEYRKFFCHSAGKAASRNHIPRACLLALLTCFGGKRGCFQRVNQRHRLIRYTYDVDLSGYFDKAKTFVFRKSESVYHVYVLISEFAAALA
jgi:hypothetical protein